jgi:hypothetical protein
VRCQLKSHLPFANGDPRTRLFLVFVCLFFLPFHDVMATTNAEETATIAGTSKDSKLSAPLWQLLRTVLQQQTSVYTTRTVPEFSLSTLPKAIADAISAGRMRLTADAKVQVYIEVAEISDPNLQTLRTLGADVQIVGEPHPNRTRGEVYTSISTVQAFLPVTMIEQAKQLPFVRFIRLPDYGIANTGSVDTQGDPLVQAEAVRNMLGVDGTGVRVGVISNGIAGIFATGCGSCTATASSPSPITLGDLPNAMGVRNSAGVLVSTSGGIISAQSFRSDGDLEAKTLGSEGAEGTALLEIIHDLAPGASLYFANAETSLEFEQAVDYLAANADIVVDDISFLEAPSYDGTSPVSANTSNALGNDGNPIRGYFTAAGNFAQNHYEGAYVDSTVDGTSFTGESGHLHLFQGMANDPMPVPGVTTDNENLGPSAFDPLIIVPPGQQISVYLAWNDSPGQSANDYDLFLVPLACKASASGLPLTPCALTGTALATSENPQTGTQDPVESLTWSNDSGANATVGIVIQNIKNQAAPRTFDMFIAGYGGKSTSPNHNFNSISGSIAAQADAGGGVVTVAAINQLSCPSPDDCVGPVDPYSSQGPTQVTPQSPTAATKPDLTAVDNVCITGAGGFGNANATPPNCPPLPASYTPASFTGTSAAAPHVAAVAALLLQTAPCLLATSNLVTPSNARMALRSNLTNPLNVAVPPNYPEPTPNNEVGFGFVDALTSALMMLPTSAALTTQTVSATSSNGANVVLTGTGKDPNNCPLQAIQWTGMCGTGTGKIGTLSTNVVCPVGINTVRLAVSNNGVSFTPANQVPYSTIIVTDFMLSATSQNVPPGSPPTYTVTVGSTAQGAFSNPITLNCSSGLPAGAGCSFSSPTVTLTSSSPTATATLTILTPSTAFSSPERFQLNFRSPPFSGVLFPVLLLLAALLTRIGRFPKSRTLLFGLCVLLLLLSLGGIGCNGATQTKSSTPTMYTVTITGTSNQLTHSTAVSLVTP